VGRYLRAVYSRFDLVLAPSRIMCAYLSRLGVSRTACSRSASTPTFFSPRRRTLDLRRLLGCLRMRACWYSQGDFPMRRISMCCAARWRCWQALSFASGRGGRSAHPSENITVLPYRRDSIELAQWLASADALVHAAPPRPSDSSSSRPWPADGRSSGVRAGAVPELIDQRVGELAEPDNAASMAAAIRRLYDRDLGTLGTAARNRVLRRFTWSHSLNIQLANYASVLTGGITLPEFARGRKSARSRPSTNNRRSTGHRARRRRPICLLRARSATRYIHRPADAHPAAYRWRPCATAAAGDRARPRPSMSRRPARQRADAFGVRSQFDGLRTLRPLAAEIPDNQRAAASGSQITSVAAPFRGDHLGTVALHLRLGAAGHVPEMNAAVLHACGQQPTIGIPSRVRHAPRQG